MDAGNINLHLFATALWVQTPQHVSLSVTIVLATFPRLFAHFLGRLKKAELSFMARESSTKMS